MPLTRVWGTQMYMLMSQLVLLSPCAFLAQDYMILPRLATWLDAEDCLFFKSRLVVRIFVWSDVVTFLLQMAGSGMTAVQSNIANIGHYVRACARADTKTS